MTMKDAELRRLSRKELLEILVEQSREIEELKTQLQQKIEDLQSRHILINNAGSIAEASLALNKVFEAAQAAADLYVAETEQMKRRNETRMQEERDRIIAEAENEASEILKEAEKTKEAKLEKLNAYVDKVQQSINNFYKKHPELREDLKK